MPVVTGPPLKYGGTAHTEFSLTRGSDGSRVKMLTDMRGRFEHGAGENN